MTKKRKLLFGLSSLLFVLYLVYVCNDRAVSVSSFMGITSYMNVPVISWEKAKEMIADKETAQIEEGIYFNYTKAPFDVENQTVYIYQNAEEDNWDGVFSLEKALRSAGYKCYFLEDGLWENKAEAIRKGHTFQMYIVGEKYYQVDVVFSGVGIMSISQLEELPKEECDPDIDPDTYYLEGQAEYIGETTILGPGTAGQYQTIQGYVKYHKKGVTSGTYPKLSYAITFVDEGGKDVSMSVFGMDSYPKWKLNAMYTDNTLVREKSAIDIWCMMDRENESVNNGSFEAKYVELILDGSYVGAYLFVEAVDENRLELDTDDVMYKCVNWNIAESASIDESIARKWKVQFPFRIKYPNEITDYAKAWGPIKDFSNVFFSGGEAGDKTLEQRIHVENTIDLDIFIRICALSDNHYKNLYYAAHVNPDGTYEMTLHPWDFDLSFGHVYSYDQPGYYYFEENVEVDYNLRVLDGLLNENPQIGDLIYETYMEYRSDILSDESIVSIINNNWEKVQASGIYARNLDLWLLEHADTDVASVTDYAVQRLAYTDRFYEQNFEK